MSMKRELDLLNFTESDAKRCKAKAALLSFDEVKEIIEKNDYTKLQAIIDKELLPDINVKEELSPLSK